MSITTTQKVIKIGSSRGVTLPAKDLRKLGVKEGESVDLIIKKTVQDVSTQEIVEKAQAILKRYKDDFKNLAER